MKPSPILLLSQDRLRKGWERLKETAIDYGLLHGQRNYVRFIILCRGRVGSNLLTSYLNSHPNILVHGEIFSRSAQNKQQALMDADPIAYLSKVAYRPYPDDVKCVGFKMFYAHARKASDATNGIWQHLMADKGIKVIHMTRTNILRSHLSRTIAAKTAKWTQAGSINSVATEDKRTKLDFEECERSFRRTVRWQQEAAAAFADHDLLHVTYEEVAADPAGTLARIQTFLGVSNVNLSSFHTRQNPEPLSELIENYADLKEKFSTTQWAPFFDD